MIFDKIRRFAKKTEDFRVSVKLWAAVACVTKKQEDIQEAVNRATEHKNQLVIAESMAIIAKTLAASGRIDEARKIADQMNGMDNYWHAEAYIFIAKFSGNEDDAKKAENAISHIHNHTYRNEARIDLKNAINGKHHARSFRADLNELAAVLSKIEEFEDDKIPHAENSAYLRLLVNQIIDRLFTETMK